MPTDMISDREHSTVEQEGAVVRAHQNRNIEQTQRTLRVRERDDHLSHLISAINIVKSDGPEMCRTICCLRLHSDAPYRVEWTVHCTADLISRPRAKKMTINSATAPIHA